MTALGTIRKVLMGAALVAMPVGALGQFSISVNIAPPQLPIYAQPLCPGDGFLWTPGYWAYEPQGYFWVPGVWVEPPAVGYLWTPAYWGYDGGGYQFFPGYWGPHMGFYGGVNYGFGYFGHGYEGGYWDRDRFFYNRSVNNINGQNERNVYVRNVTVVNNYNRVSYNGGDGVHESPRREELQAQRERHFDPTSVQQEHQQFAAHDRGQLASVNGGRPQVQAASTPQEFQQRAQRGGFGGNVPSNGPNNSVHPAQASQEQHGQMQARPQGQQTQATSQPPAQPVVSQSQTQPAQQRGDWQAGQRQDAQQRAQYQQQARQQQVQQQQVQQQQVQQQQVRQEQKLHQQQAQQQEQMRQRQQYQQRPQYQQQGQPQQAQPQQARPQLQEQSNSQEAGRSGRVDRPRR